MNDILTTTRALIRSLDSGAPLDRPQVKAKMASGAVVHVTGYRHYCGGTSFKVIVEGKKQATWVGVGGEGIAALAE